MSDRRSNRFTALMNQNNADNTEYLETPTPVSKTAEDMEKTEDFPVEAAVSAADEAPLAEESAVLPSAGSIVIQGGKKEVKSVRKQLLITPSNDQWLRKMSAQCGISVNDFVNRVFEAERKAQ